MVQSSPKPIRLYVFPASLHKEVFGSTIIKKRQFFILSTFFKTQYSAPCVAIGNTNTSLTLNLPFSLQVLVNGDASKFRIIELKQLGCAVTGLDLDDLKKLNLDIDVVAELGKHAGWSPDQVIQYLNHNAVLYF